MQDNFNKYTDNIPLNLNMDTLNPNSQNQIFYSSFGLNQNPIEKNNTYDILQKQFQGNIIGQSCEQDYSAVKINQKGEHELMSLILKEASNKSTSLAPSISTINQGESLIQKIGLLEIQNKEQEDRIQNLQKLNDQLMSAITDLNGNDPNKQKYQKEKELIQKHHDKEVSEYISQIKDLKNKVELQKAQMNEKISELEKDKLLLEKQLEGEEKNYQKKLQQYKEEKDQMNQILKDYESMRQKNQEAIQITLENKIRVLEEVIEKQKQEAEERTGQLANDTEKNVQNMKQIHENEKRIFLSKISALQSEKKTIEQQSEYNFKMFTELRNKSENQQDGLYNEMDKLRKKINTLEQRIIEKDSINIIQQQKLDGNDTVLKLKEKNYEDTLKNQKIQNEQLQEQIKKQSSELKHLQFQMQEKQFELNDKSKQLKKQILTEKKKAEQMQEAANRIKDDYSKKNSFVIQELLNKEEKIKKLNNQISKQSITQNQTGQTNYNNNNNTSYSFINNTNLSNLMQNPNCSILQQNISNQGNQNRPSYRQMDKNLQSITGDNSNIVNQENFNSSDNLNLNSQIINKSPKLQANGLNGSVMSVSQNQENCSVPHSSRSRKNACSLLIQKNNALPQSNEQLLSSNPNINQNQQRSTTANPRSSSCYQSEVSGNQNQWNQNINQFNQLEKNNIEHFDYKSQNITNIMANFLSINSPLNGVIPQSNEVLSPQSQKLDLSRSESQTIQTMRGLTPTNPSNTCIQDQKQSGIVQKSKRSFSQAVSALGLSQKNGQAKVNTKQQQQQQQPTQNLKNNQMNKSNSNKSASHSPISVQQKEITASNLTLVTYDKNNINNNNAKSNTSIQQYYSNPINCEDIRVANNINNLICGKENFLYGQENQQKKLNSGCLSILQNNNTLNQINSSRSTSANHFSQNTQSNQLSTNPNSQRDFENTKHSLNKRNVSVDQNKKNNSKVVGITLNSCRDTIQSGQNNTKNNSGQTTPINYLSVNIQNLKNEDTSYYNNQINYTPDTQLSKKQNQQQYTTPNAQKNSNNKATPQTKTFSLCGQQLIQQNNYDLHQICIDNSTIKHDKQYTPYQGKRDITFGPAMGENTSYEVSQKLQKTLDEHNNSSQQITSNLQDKAMPLQSKIKKILSQFNFDVNQMNESYKDQNLNKIKSQESIQNNQYLNYNNYNSNQQPENIQQKEIEAIFFQQMREALKSHPEIADQTNGAFRKSVENQDFALALYGLKEMIQKININEQEKKDLQIEITTLQSKCSLDKASIYNHPSFYQNNNNNGAIDTQNNLPTSSLADSKINQIILDNLHSKTFDTQSVITLTQEKENIKALPQSLEINNKFKPITQISTNGSQVNINNLSIALSGLKSPQFTVLKEDNKNGLSHPFSQNNEYINEYNSNGDYKNFNSQGNKFYNINIDTKSIKNNQNNTLNQQQQQYNSARINQKMDQEQHTLSSGRGQDLSLQHNKKVGKQASSISINISNNMDQSPTMYMVNGGLVHQKNSQSNLNPQLLTNYSTNHMNYNSNKSNISQNEKERQNSYLQYQNHNSTIQNKNIIQANFQDQQKINSYRNIENKINITNQQGQKKINPLKDVI